MKSRFGESNFTTEQQHPILIRNDSWLTNLITRDAHDQVMHFGVETTLAKIREKYWIIRGRNSVKNMLRKSVISKRFQGKTMKPPEEVDLPSFRVNHLTYAFSTTGLDYAGPLIVRNKGHPNSKVYILLFTCASSRAIHLELTTDMKSPAFIRAFQRFSSRRRKPNEIINDNFKTFKSTKVKRFMVNSNIHRRFILPASPLWGGFYERLVRSVKSSLRKVLKKSLVTFEELQTILCEIESVINSRPLCYSSDEDVNSTLTPNHLIFGRTLNNNHGISNFGELTPTDCTKRINYLRTLLTIFWRFNTSYLNELKQRHTYERKKTSGNVNLKLKDIVLIKDDIPIPRTKWKMGKVEELIIGRDGKIRGAKLKVNSDQGTSTLVHRPIQKLIPFEIQDENVPDPSLTPNVNNEESSGGASDPMHVRTRLNRRAAIEGQELRRLREQYN